jgi:hypothetical protein
MVCESDLSHWPRSLPDRRGDSRAAPGSIDTWIHAECQLPGMSDWSSFY